MNKNSSQYANDILNAISIISEKNIQDAEFDRTIKAVIVRCEDKNTGKYIIRYNDIEQEAYAINSSVKYRDNEYVFVLVPKNNSMSIKTIIGSVDHLVTENDNIQETSELYNTLGPNILISDNKVFAYSSYAEDIYECLYTINPPAEWENKINIDQNNLNTYLTSGDALVLKMDVQTLLDAGQRKNGEYGLEYTLVFSDNGDESKQIQRTYTISQMDVYGNPYGLNTVTSVEHLQNVDARNLKYIKDIYLFCRKFPYTNESKAQIPDIFISNISLNGANLLDTNDLMGYSLNIDYSTNGKIFNENNTDILLLGQMKLKGRLIQNNVKYYWFKENGLVVKGHEKYSPLAGFGWECLNYKSNNEFVGLSDNRICITIDQDNSGLNSNDGQEYQENKVLTILANQDKHIGIKCIAIYNGNTKASKEIVLINDTIEEDRLSIISSDGDIRDYYYNNGSPTLTCVINGESDLSDYDFVWSKVNADGTSEVLENAAEVITAYLTAKEQYDNALETLSKVAESDKETYKSSSAYQDAITNYQTVQKDDLINKNQYINVKIGNIKNYAKITCGVEKNDLYFGSASITLYNHMESKGEYNLQILNGSQVFQYDDDGISPCSEIKEKPLKILDLSFALFDNVGQTIPYESIVANGEVLWLLPKQDTLLVKVNPDDEQSKPDSDLNDADKALAADYYIYKNLKSLSYSIAPTFDYKKTNNNIRLYVKYKDMIFDVYTDFTFPKSGDPGTNGTKYYAKIIPVQIDQDNVTELSSERVYFTEGQAFYNDSGSPIDALKFVLFNGGERVNGQASVWSCPMSASVVGDTPSVSGKRSHFRVVPLSSDTSYRKVVLNENFFPRDEYDFIDIVRAQYGQGQDLKYFAQLPICYVKTNNSDQYRLKVKPQTGYSYVIYKQDGTNPQYDNVPFEIILQKKVNGIYIEQEPSQYNFSWYLNGEFKEYFANNNKAIVIPSDTYNGERLNNSIVVTIDFVGSIQIPVYMLINRYGHKALNDWDGNGIELGQDDGIILTPQMGAGRKESDNSFTGVLMGEVKRMGQEDSEVGLLGYNKGQRTIFLDAQSGKAEFGKNDAGKITINPNLKVNGKDAGLLYSGNYTLPFTVDSFDLDVATYRPESEAGMVIDLSTPQIGFGSGNFYVTSNGNLHSESGEIGGWQIVPHALQSTYAIDGNVGGIYLNSDGSEVTSPAVKVNNGTKDIFSVNYKGDLHSESGDIGGWNISSVSLSNSSVGMRVPTTNDDVVFYAGSTTPSTAAPYYVQNDGYFKSTKGKIANWTIGDNSLTDGHTGLGSTAFRGDTVNIWAGTSTKAEDINFAVSNQGKVYAVSGQIGNWNLSTVGFNSGTVGSSEGGMSLDSHGTISGGNSTYQWTINKNGNAAFNNIDASGGKIGNWNINQGAITGPSGLVSLNNDGTITATRGYIGNVEIRDGGLYGSNWHVSNNSAVFNGLHIDAANGTAYSGGSAGVSGSGYDWGPTAQTSSFDPGRVTDGSGRTIDDRIKELYVAYLNASTGIFGNLQLNRRVLNISAGFKPVSETEFEQCEILIRSNNTTAWKTAYVLSNDHSDLGLHVFVTADMRA